MSLRTFWNQFTAQQRHVVIASYLGWTLDAFDFFILVFVLKDIAADFHTTISSVTIAITLTLAMRPVGALIFGLMADQWGRRPVLMLNVLMYSLLEFASGFSPSLTALIIMRALYGVAMGGEWGIGSSLAMESIPANIRGSVSGILQAGYPSGYLLASLVFYFLFPIIGWRGMLMIGVLPALMVFYVRRHVPESPVFKKRQHQKSSINWYTEGKRNLKLFIWAVGMMTCFNFFSHGTQDIYPTFLEQQRGLSVHAVGLIAMTYNVGAILGGLFFGTLSSRIGRRRAIIIASLFALPIIPLWALSETPFLLAASAFLLQFCVQGAWGIVPAHLNELSPDSLRGTFPGFAYQLGNLLASYNATLQTTLAADHHGDYATALMMVTGVVAVVLSLVTAFGPEASDRRFNE